mmetsp:Transcript_14291/g.43175  ORF Transcript_14291/g.43175 Transcript_14291/m.43175 type:complete len:254 (+) Transcript_14291:1430-2191(+)
MAQDPQRSAGAREAHVHAPHICQKADALVLAATAAAVLAASITAAAAAAATTDAGEDDHVCFSPLETVHSGKGDVSQGASGKAALEGLPQHRQLCTVGADHRHRPYLLPETLVQPGEQHGGKVGLLLIDQGRSGARPGILPPRHTVVERQRAEAGVPVPPRRPGLLDAGVVDDAPLVEEAGGPAADGGVHAVLLRQQSHGVPRPLQALEQGLAEVAGGGGAGQHSGRQLLGIPHQHRPPPGPQQLQRNCRRRL